MCVCVCFFNGEMINRSKFQIPLIKIVSGYCYHSVCTFVCVREYVCIDIVGHVRSLKLYLYMNKIHCAVPCLPHYAIQTLINLSYSQKNGANTQIQTHTHTHTHDNGPASASAYIGFTQKKPSRVREHEWKEMTHSNTHIYLVWISESVRRIQHFILIVLSPLPDTVWFGNVIT